MTSVKDIPGLGFNPWIFDIAYSCFFHDIHCDTQPWAHTAPRRLPKRRRYQLERPLSDMSTGHRLIL